MPVFSGAIPSTRPSGRGRQSPSASLQASPPTPLPEGVGGEIGAGGARPPASGRGGGRRHESPGKTIGMSPFRWRLA